MPPGAVDRYVRLQKPPKLWPSTDQHEPGPSPGSRARRIASASSTMESALSAELIDCDYHSTGHGAVLLAWASTAFDHHLISWQLHGCSWGAVEVLARFAALPGRVLSVHAAGAHEHKTYAGLPEMAEVVRLLLRRPSPQQRLCADAGRQPRPSLIQQYNSAPAPTAQKLTSKPCRRCSVVGMRPHSRATSRSTGLAIAMLRARQHLRVVAFHGPIILRSLFDPAASIQWTRRLEARTAWSSHSQHSRRPQMLLNGPRSLSTCVVVHGRSAGGGRCGGYGTLQEEQERLVRPRRL